ncbi:hypothetical protein NDU88_004017 [Pleurodeles waltl]|uniref:Uncharacterized protein n=1 Tax=Pleurodeles waltl TaxID=8319 RepID=A0AAV7WUF5_PLEWA|nr:hypothetical protein NDU88_004017 [Pleurodeles waltl]
MSTDSGDPGGTSSTSDPDPEVFFTAPWNTENPEDAGPFEFEGPEAEEDGTPPQPPQREKMSTEDTGDSFLISQK